MNDLLLSVMTGVAAFLGVLIGYFFHSRNTVKKYELERLTRQVEELRVLVGSLMSRVAMTVPSGYCFWTSGNDTFLEATTGESGTSGSNAQQGEQDETT